MKVHPRDLLPGCLIIEDVMGKTTYPLIPKNTVVEPIHIEILKRFNIQHVDIAPKLVNGELFEAIKPKTTVKDDKKEIKKVSQEESKKNWTFYDYYVDTVKQTKEWLQNWNRTSELDIVPIREMLLPLVESGEKQQDILIHLHHYTDKNDYFYHHIVSMSVISSFLAKKLNYDKNERLQIAIASYLSDIGMLLIDDQLYYKDGVLTEEEYERVKKHPVLSYRLIEKIKYLSKNVKIAVVQHHERLDGSGYPIGLKHDKIHPFARVIAISDTFHAMTSERHYKKKESPFRVAEELINNHFGKLDMKIVMALVDCIVNFSNGTKVRLSNNEQGQIVFIDKSHPTRPMIKLGDDQILNLTDHPNIYIEEIVK